jgi:DNA repair protein RecN (Recombination protein N)
MLLNLFIQNYALIQKLDIGFGEGMSVITGETGAGKSILLGALAIALGKRADTQVLYDKTRKCIVDCEFNLMDYGLKDFFDEHGIDYDDITYLRREINPAGKSRSFINDTPVNLNVLKDLGDRLVDVHSQHKTITLNKSDIQLAVVDQFAGNNQLLQQYGREYNAYLRLIRQIQELTDKDRQAKDDQDYLQFQLNELESSGLKPGETEGLEAELSILNHSGDIKTMLSQLSGILAASDDSILNRMAEMRSICSQLAKYQIGLDPVIQRIESNYIDLKDIAGELEKANASVNLDPGRMKEVSERLDLLWQLFRKHRVNSSEELIGIRDTTAARLSEISGLDEAIARLKSAREEKLRAIEALSSGLTRARTRVMPDIEKEITKSLKMLGMPDASFVIRHEPTDGLTPDGTDKVRFFFNANKGGELMELSRVASGGELSRLMLCVKSLISQRNLVPTIIFDEIDMGVSGPVAGKVAGMLHGLSSAMQVIVITHLPQIASRGEVHYNVYKEAGTSSAETRIKILGREERIAEIAKMLSGTVTTAAATNAARELLSREPGPAK